MGEKKTQTYEVWGEIVLCEDGYQIDDVGDGMYMGSFSTQREAEAARIRMVDVVGLREVCRELLDCGISPELRKAIEDILRT
jgi:hypothetical protein